MKKLLLLFIVNILLAFGAFAQTTYTWFFNNNMHEAGTGPDLTAACTGSYSSEALPIGITRNVFHYSKGCGITFDDSIAGFLSLGSYTIEMYVRIDTNIGFKKLIDYKYRASDNGLYNNSGNIQLWPFTKSDSAYIPDSAYVYVAVTRDDATKNMFTYVNGMFMTTCADTGSYYIYDAHKKLIFFEDDATTGGEQVSGTVSMIRITNTNLDSNTIKTRFHKLAVPNIVGQNANIRIYPNPATDNVQIITTAKYPYIITDITGKQMLNGTLLQGDNNITIQSLPVGMYFLKLLDNNSRQVFKILKQ